MAPRRSCATTSAARWRDLAGQELETAIDIFRDLVTPSGVKVAHTADDLARMTAHSAGHGRVGPRHGSTRSASCARSIPPRARTQARYEIFHDRLAAPILDWRDQQENARLERATQRAEREAQTQREQARRFKRRARITLGLAVSLLILLVAVVVLLQYARDQSASASREKRAALQGHRGSDVRSGSPRGPVAARPAGRTSRCCCISRPISESPQPVAERSLVATLQAVKRSGPSASSTGTRTRSRASPSARPARRWPRPAATRRSGSGLSPGVTTIRSGDRCERTGRSTVSRSTRLVDTSRRAASTTSSSGASRGTPSRE